MTTPDLFGDLLASVSRSFYLTIRVLPRALRRPVGLAYLLARTSDTIADCAGNPVEERLELLQRLGESIVGIGDGPGEAALSRLALRLENRAEATLLEAYPRLLELLEATEPGDRGEIIRVLGIIIEGQMLDLIRFGTGGGGGVQALERDEDLHDYTWRVAGCVGEFWTRLSLRHLPRYSRLEEAELLPLGAAFGRGLQLVNILRDAPEDLANGRCYLPLESLQRHGLMPEQLLRDPEAARPLFNEWREVALGHFEAGFRYIEALRPRRMRLACFLPWGIGVKTLSSLAFNPPLEAQRRIKISRREVREVFCHGLCVAFCNRALSSFKEQQMR